jgi:hypothetical protein
VGTHYETLGVRPDAAPAELRAAYLAKARVLHPDRHIGEAPRALAATERAMREVNHAWFVLGDPARRRDYDAMLRAAATPTATASRPANGATRPTNGATRATSAPPPRPPTGHAHAHAPTHEHELLPREHALFHLVRMGPVLALLALLGAIFVFTAFAAGGHSVDVPPTPTVAAGTPQKGNCLLVGTTVRVARCDGPYDAQVLELVSPGQTCPSALVPIRWDERTWLCVRPRQ